MAEIDEEVVRELQDIVGKDNIITDEQLMEAYSHDETPGLKYIPGIVVKPETAEQISEIMKLANSEKVPVTPRGGGTGLSGGALPVYGGILLSTEMMNRIKEIDRDNLMVVTEPGVITGKLQKEVEKHGLFYPPDPISLDSCFIGGNIAENAGGPRAVKYGVTRNYVSGLEIVLPNGEILKLSGKLLKNVTGYSLLDVIIGSEGTLAIITEIILKILPFPEGKVDLLIPFKRIEDATEAVTKFLNDGIVPATIELMEGESVRMCEEFLGRDIPFSNAEAHIIVELDGNKRGELEEDYEQIGNIALNTNAIEVFVVEDRAMQVKVWEPRRSMGEALKAQPGKIVAREDLVVPRSRIPALIRKLKKICEDYAVKLYSFGHMGDGNIHVDVVDPSSITMDEKRLPQFVEEIYKETILLDGAITAEHGIGLTKIKYLKFGLDSTQIKVMRGIKGVFDPNNILNPGKIFEN